jgi:hypothetical protein
MHVRVARFEGGDTSRLDQDYEDLRKMMRSPERHEDMPEEAWETLRGSVRRWVSLADRATGTSLDMAFTDSAEDAQRVHEALDSLTPPDTAGRRTSAEIYEVMLDEQL